MQVAEGCRMAKTSGILAWWAKAG